MMKTIQKFLLVCTMASLCGFAVADDADDESDLSKKACSVHDVVGKWLFATSIGRQMLPDFPPDKDMTALGTWVVKPDGSLSGTFDVTVEDTFFAPGIPYNGSIVVNSDCTGTVTFVTALGSTRIDSIAVVGHREIIGMSQDPFNVWTYQVRRVGFARRGRD